MPGQKPQTTLAGPQEAIHPSLRLARGIGAGMRLESSQLTAKSKLPTAYSIEQALGRKTVPCRLEVVLAITFQIFCDTVPMVTFSCNFFHLSDEALRCSGFWDVI